MPPRVVMPLRGSCPTEQFPYRRLAPTRWRGGSIGLPNAGKTASLRSCGQRCIPFILSIAFNVTL
jgi:hypothetical protein